MSPVAALKSAIETRTARVAVIGAGYVGLSAALEAARAGFRVIAVDVDPERVRHLAAGQSYIADVTEADLRPLVRLGQLQATTDFDELHTADVVLICVPTPLTPNRDPDLTFVRRAAGAVAERLHPGQLISLESTTYPGTTAELVLPLLTARGLAAGRDFALAYCPERVDPGNPRFRPGQLARVVGGVTPTCLAVARQFYQCIAAGVVSVSSTQAAEMTKLYENIYRSVNIALVNELAMLCDRMDLDVWEVVRAAGSKPFGIQIFQPGPGVGGHCIPLDPHYLSWKAREFDFSLRFVDLAGDINSGMPYFVVTKLARLLNDRARPLRGSRILVLGVAYKRDVTDVREAPALRILQLLRHAGAVLSYHDPLVPELQPETPGGRTLQSVDLTPDLLAGLDAAVIVTDHTAVDYRLVVDQAPLVLDTRNVTAGMADPHGHVRRL